MTDPDLQPNAVVPYWSMQLSANVAEIKARVEALPDLVRKVDQLQREVVQREDFQQVSDRVDKLWDLSQRLRGAAWLLAIAETLLGGYVAAHVFHVLP